MSIVRGSGVDHENDGFRYIIIDGKQYSAQAVADVVKKACVVLTSRESCPLCGALPCDQAPP